MRKTSIYRATILTVLALSLTACGDTDEIQVIVPEQGQEAQQGQENAGEITSEGTSGASGQESADGNTEQLSETEKAILEYELRYNKGEFTAEDYQALAALYQEQGLIRKQRDLLEQSYRLYGDQQAFETLQGIAVNLAEEDAAVREMGELMLQNLELEEYLNESINLISTDEWFQTMMPKLYEGSRTYFLQRNAGTGNETSSENETSNAPALIIQVGYDRTGTAYSNVWYTGEQAKMLRYSGDSAQHSGDTVQLLTTQIVNGVYEGPFESWICDGATGDIYYEAGNFANGVLTGDYTAKVHEGKEASEVFSLWSNREGMSYTTYNGHFDEQGKATLEQPTEKKIKTMIKNTDYSTCIVYAKDVNDCLYVGLKEGEDASAYTFGIEAMGWISMPEVTVYEAVETQADGSAGSADGTASADGDMATGDGANAGTASDIKVRVFDGQIQVYLNDAWVNMGTVEQYVQEDPFMAYENNKGIVNNTGENGEGQDGDVQGGETGISASIRKPSTGTIPKDVVKPATTTKPATQTPAETTPQQPTTQQPTTPATPTTPQQPTTPTTPQQPTTPTAPTTPQQPATPQQPTTPTTPTTPPASDDSGSGSSGNTGSDSSGNDVDIEWTDDIL